MGRQQKSVGIFDQKSELDLKNTTTEFRNKSEERKPNKHTNKHKFGKFNLPSKQKKKQDNILCGRS